MFKLSFVWSSIFGFSPLYLGSGSSALLLWCAFSCFILHQKIRSSVLVRFSVVANAFLKLKNVNTQITLARVPQWARQQYQKKECMHQNAWCHSSRRLHYLPSPLCNYLHQRSAVRYSCCEIRLLVLRLLVHRRHQYWAVRLRRWVTAWVRLYAFAWCMFAILTTRNVCWGLAQLQLSASCTSIPPRCE